MEWLHQHFYGGIYSDDYEELSDGGPKCFQDMDYNFRFLIATFSVILNIFILRN